MKTTDQSPGVYNKYTVKGGKEKDGLEAFNFKDVKDVSANCLCGQGFKQSIKNNGIYDSTEMHTMTEYLMIWKTFIF